MVGPSSFTLQFIFEEGDYTKALRLHHLLKKHGIVGNVRIVDENGANRKEDRLDGLLNCMKAGETYTTGALWKSYRRNGGRGGMKTFQRDLNTLLIQGIVNGAPGQHPTKKGRTFFWTRSDKYGRYPRRTTI